METTANTVMSFGEDLYFQASMAGNRAGTKGLLKMVDEEVSTLAWMILEHAENDDELANIKYRLIRLKERLEDATCTVFDINIE